MFPPRKEVLGAIDEALAGAGVPRRDARSETVFKELASRFHSEIEDPTPHHKRTATTTNIWHLRKDFVDLIRKRHGNTAAKAAGKAIARSITCYAAKLHLNKGYSLLPKPDGTPRQPKAGYAATFEEVKTFDGRVWGAARTADLRGKDDPDRPWINGLPRLVFVSDMGDAFTRKSDFPFLKREVLAPIESEEGRRHLWLCLTKRPERMAEFARQIGGFPGNVCAMTTVTTPGTLGRVDELRRVEAHVRGLSLEPLRERIPPGRLDLEGIDWVILGGESGASEWARSFPLEWAEELRDHCAENGVAFFLKQLGRKPTRGGEPVRLKDGHGGDWNEWPVGLRVREFPDCFHGYRSDEGPGLLGLRRVIQGGLTPDEGKDFKRLDKIVSKAARTFVDASAALYEIRERRLYRAKHGTFADYCETVHQISRQYANKLIKAGRIRREMETIVSKRGLPMPDNEGQLRELARLSDPKEREEVLVAAVEIVNREDGDGHLTARAIRQVVDARSDGEGARPSTSRPPTPVQRLTSAREALEELESALEKGADPRKALAALRRILGA